MNSPNHARHGEFFDASSEPGVPASENTANDRESRPFLGIQFRCCRTYGRIYRDPSGMRYSGGCPRCGARVSVPIGPGGQGTRFFSAG
ncbi:hypothetical protein [Rhodopirellula sallentina]|uniref:Uncharacterized protein n=1 Tax=Rhodopirellula sallentina SM41 TaxID=1263870 RepID=M5UJL0_9BACT|nr:hypothetical protein [Rhodopirellula sallentina]EMI56193.1 hypothetical protein RSSM_02350 [Rhodopirellula sallentina SM41]